MEPYKAPNPFPVYVKRAVHSANAEAAWPASAFFPMVVTSTLRPLCKDDSDVPQLQTNLITGKLMSLVQEGPAGEQQLHALCQHFKENENSFTMEPAVLSAFNAFVAWMMFCKDIVFVSQDVDIIIFILLINTTQHQVQHNRILLLRRCHHLWRVCQRSRRFFYMAFKRTARAGRSSKVSKRSSPTVRWMQTMPRSSERLGNHSTR